MTNIPKTQLDTAGTTVLEAPDREIDVREVFGRLAWAPEVVAVGSERLR